MQPRGQRGRAGVPSGGKPCRQSATRIALRIPKRVDLNLAWSQVPAPGIETLLAAACGAQDAGSATPSLGEPRRRSGMRELGADPWKPGWVCGAPKPGQNSRKQTRQQVAGTASKAGLPRRRPRRAYRRAPRGPATPPLGQVRAVGLRPARPAPPPGNPPPAPPPRTHCYTLRRRTLSSPRRGGRDWSAAGPGPTKAGRAAAAKGAAPAPQPCCGHRRGG